MDLLQIDETPKAGREDIRITERAAAQLRQLLDNDAKPDCALRIRVLGGGCSGLQYNLSFDNEQKETDLEWTSRGVRILLDPASYKYLAGSTVDFEGGLNGTGFKLDNPNASGTCGCGESFAI